MIGYIRHLKGFYKNQVPVNFIFTLHFYYTALLLLACSGLVAWRQQFGTAIDCLARDDIPTSFINDYCYIHSTYSLKESWNKSVGVEIVFQGVDKYSPGATKVYHTYYQWVSIALLLQSLLFCIPRGFWRCMEAGKIQKLLSNISFSESSDDSEQKITDKSTKVLVQRFLYGSRNNKRYFLMYWLAELLNVVNVICQVFFMDAFLGGGIRSFYVQLSQFASWDWTNHSEPVFPKMAQCDYYNYGRTGDVQRHDVLCLLPINVLNEKIYLLLSLWYFVLSVLSGVIVCYDMILLLSSKVRFHVLSAGLRYDERCVVEKVLYRCSSGDWFLLCLLAKYMNPTNFRDFMLCLYLEWSESKRGNARRLLEDDEKDNFRTKNVKDYDDREYC